MPLSPEFLVPRLGEELVNKGLLTNDQLSLALKEQVDQKNNGVNIPLGQILVDKKFVTRENLDHAITNQLLGYHKALQDSNHYLEQRVKERTEELEKAYKKLSEFSQMKANFVANVSHELRTPLTHIKGYLDLFLSDESITSNELLQEGLTVMQQSADRLHKLINDLIQFSTSENGTLQLELSTFDINLVAEKVLSRNRSSADKKNIRLNLISQLGAILVLADKSRIEWTINQLVENAIKFTNVDGAVSIEINPALENVFISVKDSGIGVDTASIKAMFEPFHQLDSSTKRKQGGIGLGLALVKKIMDAHNTQISVLSTPGAGSTFKFSLPSSH